MVTVLDPRSSGSKLLVVAIALIPIQLDLGATFRVALADAVMVIFAIAIGPRLIAAGFENTKTVLVPFFFALGVAVLAGIRYQSLYAEGVIDRGIGFGVLILYAAGASILHERRLEQGLVLAAWMSILAHLSVIIGLGLFDQKVANRNAGGLIDPNNAGVLAAALLVWSIGHPSQLPRAPAWERPVRIIGLLVALISTGSRTGWIGFAVALVALLIVRRKASGLPLLTGTQRRVLVIIGLVGLPFIISAVQRQLRGFEFRPDNVAKRANTFSASFDSFLEAPLSGRGLLHTLEEGIGFPHDTFLFLIGDAGLFGLLAFLAITVIPAVAAHRMARARAGWFRRFGAAYLGAHVAMVISSFGVEASYQRQWWVFIGAAMGLYLRSRHEATAPVPEESLPRQALSGIS